MKKRYILITLLMFISWFVWSADNSTGVESADSSYWSYFGWVSAASTDKRVQGWIKQLHHVVDHAGGRLDHTVATVLQKDGPMDQVMDRTLQQATQRFENAANRIVKDTRMQLEDAMITVLQKEGPIDQARDRTLQQATQQLEVAANQIIRDIRRQLEDTVITVLQKDGPIDQAMDRTVQQTTQHLEGATNQIIRDTRRQLEDTVITVLQKGGPVDQAMDRVLQQATQHLEGAANQIIRDTRRQLEDTVITVLQKDGLIDQAAGRALEQVAQVANQVVTDATKQLEDTMERALKQAQHDMQGAAQHILTHDVRPLGHELVVDLAQNVGKMALSSAMGFFGIALIYKGLQDFLESQREAYRVCEELDNRIRVHDSDKNDVALFLSHEVNNVGSFSYDRKQQIGALIAATGVTTFVAACMLCCYWIH